MKKTAYFLCCICIFLHGRAQDYARYPMWNVTLPMDARVNDLVSRLTLEEKIAQMLNSAPAIPRLGIPAYEWWNEILHGVARTPYKTTVFPQAIGMAATWDTLALRLMAHYAGLEGRAINNKAVEGGNTGSRYRGLTYWTPNINIFRDPRWGRGQETYGEDPYLTARLGAAFVRGLQGDDPQYLLAAACAKHYAVHSGPEASRHFDNYTPTAYDLWDTYLPAFRELVVEAKVAGVMCAYNALYGQPCCGSDVLMNDILRRQWKFTGYVTSDCWAIDDFVKHHKTHTSNAAASADAVLHGTDVECGTSVYKSLLDAVKTGLLSEEQINISVKRLFMIRYRLGMFDPADKVPFRKIPFSTLEAAPHKAHALKMARESIVLLKNEHGLLPLSKQIKRIAVLGPNADNREVLLGNYNGFPSKVVSLLEGIRQKLGGSTEVVYQAAIDYTSDRVFAADTVHGFYTFKGQQGIQAAYFNNENLEGQPVQQSMISDINFAYYDGQIPAAGVNPRHFSARFSTTVTVEKDSTLFWQLEGDDGYRLYINDSLAINAWQNEPGIRNWKWKIKAGNPYRVVLEYRQAAGGARIRMQHGIYRKADQRSAAASVASADVIVFAGGISPSLEGEEMPVNATGFSSGDRTTIMLPSVQTELLKELQATGKPVVFVLLTGSAIAMPWEQEHIPAILNAWYGGQDAGTAVADVLFGDYNPAGRLPVTFYKNDESLPGFKDYGMSGRTYRYFEGEVLYPFGYGLSYTSFRYGQLQMPARLGVGKPLVLSVKVTNTGLRDGDEVAQLYLSYPDVKGKAPLRSLKGFQRIYLRKGESRILHFVVPPAQLQLIDEAGKVYSYKGRLSVSVGGGQPVNTAMMTANVLPGQVFIQ